MWALLDFVYSNTEVNNSVKKAIFPKDESMNIKDSLYS